MFLVLKTDGRQAQVIQGLDFIRWGFITNWWGLGCPSHCGPPSASSLFLFLLLGFLSRFLVCLACIYLLLFQASHCPGVSPLQTGILPAFGAICMRDQGVLTLSERVDTLSARVDALNQRVEELAGTLERLTAVISRNPLLARGLVRSRTGCTCPFRARFGVWSFKIQPI